jgi:hypothetical protein
MKWKRSTTWLIGFIGAFWGLMLFAIPFVLMHQELITEFVNDRFTREVLASPIVWEGGEFAVGLAYLAVVIASIFMIVKKRKYLPAILVLLVGTACTIFTLLPVVVPKVAEYTQGAAMEFYRNNSDGSCYIHPLGIGNYKYGHLFYAKKPQNLSPFYNKNVPEDQIGDWLLKGNIDHPALFVSKITDADEYVRDYKLELLYTKNGLAFLKRNIDSSQIK